MSLKALLKINVFAAAAVVLGFAIIFLVRAPKFADVKSRHTSSYLLLRDREGEVLHIERVNYKRRRLDWIPIEQLPSQLIEALVQVEDRRFRWHLGVDGIALASALRDRVFYHRPLRGASTLAMQLVSLLDRDLRPHGVRRSMFQKMEQAVSGLRLSLFWSKNEQLEAYFNLVGFRGEIEGIAAAARFFFDKDVPLLSTAEDVFLVAMLGNPQLSLNKTADRACRLFSEVDCEAIRTSSEFVLKRSYGASEDEVLSLAPQLGSRLLREKGHNVTSTLDAQVQRYAAMSLKEHIDALSDRNVHEGAVLVLDNSTGNVLAYVANRQDFSRSSRAYYFDHVQGRRQAGSTLKPFLYAQAFANGFLSPESLILDAPLEIPTARGIYEPENYDHTFRGWLPVREALANSINTTAIRTLQLVDPDVFVETLARLGFTDLASGTDYGFSLALGAADVTLWELTNAYRALANDGIWSPARLENIESPQSKVTEVFPAQVIEQIKTILSDRSARANTFGLQNALSTPFWSAVKTGTSKDMRDNWCLGFSHDVTVGVWVGNTDGAPMWHVSGVDGAAPVWNDVISELSGASSKLAKKLHYSFVPVASNKVADVLPIEIPESKFVKIVSPPNESFYAIDPEIPSEFQRMNFLARGRTRHLFWKLDDKILGDANQETLWQPQAGRHYLALVDGKGSVEARVQFVVKASNESAAN